MPNMQDAALIIGGLALLGATVARGNRFGAASLIAWWGSVAWGVGLYLEVLLR